MTKIDGPRIAPRAGSAQSLVVLLHGYGADGNDLIELGRVWQSVMPHTAFVAPHAPDFLPYEQMAGRQWFPLTFRDPDEYWRGTNEAAPALNAFLDGELERHRLPSARLGLVGFSQGTMMALQVAPRRPQSVGCVVGYSGHLAGAEHLKVDTVSRPPILLVHGTDDEVIPSAALHLARQNLADAGFAVEWHLREGLGHGIDEEGLRLGASFLKKALSA